MAKKMEINTAICDARQVTEETLQSFESVTINSALVLTNERSRNLLNKYQVTMNCASVLDVAEDVKFSMVNGSGEIKSTDMVAAEKRFLMVNGSLDIGPNTEKVLAGYAGILVNGSAYYPESMGSCLGMMTVNGSRNAYPDGAIVLKRNAVIDKVFALRAKERLYWSAKRMVMVDPDLDADMLVNKGAYFSSKEVILTESKVEKLVDRIDEKAELVIVPDGTAVISDDVTLDGILVKKYGKKLYIIGNLTVGDGKVLEELEYLLVRGDVTVPEEHQEMLLEKAREITGQVKKTMKGRCVSGKSNFCVTGWLLEQEADGLHVCDCAQVKIDRDIPGELLLKRLTITDCAVVNCSQDQRSIVGAISDNVAAISSGDALATEEPREKQEKCVINCMEYVW